MARHLNNIISFAINVFQNDRNYQNDMADGDYTTVILCLENIIIGTHDMEPFPEGWSDPRLTMEQLREIILSHGEAEVEEICLDNDNSDAGVIIDDLERMLTLNPHIDYDMTQVWSYNGTRRKLNESVLLLAIHLANDLLAQE